jgi:hypothetical protein
MGQVLHGSATGGSLTLRDIQLRAYTPWSGCSTNVRISTQVATMPGDWGAGAVEGNVTSVSVRGGLEKCGKNKRFRISMAY